jgi:ISXO2-like transposase domain
MGKDFKGHETVSYKDKECSKVVDGVTVTTKTVEGYFSLVKRGVHGVYHHWGKQHLHRYLSEFDLRYNNRTVSDTERAEKAVKGSDGKRLMYRDSCARRES